MLKKIILAVALVAGVAIVPVVAQAEDAKPMVKHHHHRYHVMREHTKAHQ